jgi:GntR family transcriptional regulator
MKRAVDRKNPTPLYEQIKTALRDQILAGGLRPGARLPTEAALCEQYSVSRITVVKALNDLMQDGLIERIQGKGSIVLPARVLGSLNEVRGFSETAVANGFVPHSTILSLDVIEGDAELARLFRLQPADRPKFMRFRRLRLLNDTPAVLLDSTVTEDLGRKMAAQPLEDVSFYRLYELLLGRRIERNDASLQPVVADRAVARLLGVARGSPHFAFRGMSYLEGDIPIELSTGTYRGDLFTFAGTMSRIREEVIAKKA